MQLKAIVLGVAPIFLRTRDLAFFVEPRAACLSLPRRI